MFPWNIKYPNVNDEILNLDWLLKNVKELIKVAESLTDWQSTHEAEYEQLKALYDAIMAGNFPDSIKDAFYNWCRLNIEDLVGQLVHNVFFEITDAGYFVANIPESWNDIIFNTTGLDINVDLQPEYGHLVLSY